MSDVDRQIERVSHQASDSADDAVGGEDASCRKAVAGCRRAFHIVHRLDQIVDAERDRRDEDDAEKLEAGEGVIERGDRQTEPKPRHRVGQRFDSHSADVQTQSRRAPRYEGTRCDGNEAGRDPLVVANVTEPTREDDAEAGDANQRRHKHLQRWAHGDEGHRHTSQRSKERCTRGELTDKRGNKAADHQQETLDEDPRETGFPGFHRVARLQLDGQHDHEDDHEHVRHADSRGERAHIIAPGLFGEFIREVGVVGGAQEEHHPHRRQDSSKDKFVGHLQNETKQPGQHQHVDEDIRSKSEESVPVAGGPEFRFVVGHVVLTCWGEGVGHSSRAESRAAELATQPKMPP